MFYEILYRGHPSTMGTSCSDGDVLLRREHPATTKHIQERRGHPATTVTSCYDVLATRMTLRQRPRHTDHPATTTLRKITLLRRRCDKSPYYDDVATNHPATTTLRQITLLRRRCDKSPCYDHVAIPISQPVSSVGLYDNTTL